MNIICRFYYLCPDPEHCLTIVRCCSFSCKLKQNKVTSFSPQRIKWILYVVFITYARTPNIAWRLSGVYQRLAIDYWSERKEKWLLYNYQLEVRQFVSPVVRIERNKVKIYIYLLCLHQSCKDSHPVLKEKKWRVLFNYRGKNTFQKGTVPHVF